MAKVEKKFYVDPVADGDVLEQLNRLPHGEMSKTVVLALRRYFEQESAGIDLGELRLMFETVLDSKLAGLQLTGRNEKEAQLPGGLVDRLGEGLLLE